MYVITLLRSDLFLQRNDFITFFIGGKEGSFIVVVKMVVRFPVSV